MTVSPGAVTRVSISLDPGTYDGFTSDWWIAAATPFGWFSFVYPSGWEPGVTRSIAAPMMSLSQFDILNMMLPEGDYTFYFAVDDNADGMPDATWWDSVSIHIP